MRFRLRLFDGGRGQLALPAPVAARAPGEAALKTLQNAQPAVLYGASGLDDLALQRWGIVHEDSDLGRRQASWVQALVEYRARQCGIEASDIFRLAVPRQQRGDDALLLLTKKYLKLPLYRRPRYLLLLGDLDQVSLDVQRQLIAQGAFVGRLCFVDTERQPLEAAYRAYCQKLIASETGRANAPEHGRLLFYANDFNSDRYTAQSYGSLVKPCYKNATRDPAFQEVQPQEIYASAGHSWDGPGCQGDPGTRETDQDTLMYWAQCDQPTALLSSSHGGGRTAKWHEQGSLVLDSKRWLVGEYFRERAFLPGGFWFMQACYGAATPGTSVYREWLQNAAISERDRKAALSDLAARPFVAYAPQVALANPRGPLAVFGHADMTWTHGFAENAGVAARTSRRTGHHAYWGVLRAVALGGRFGVACRSLVERGHATGQEILRLRLLQRQPDYQAESWMQFLDLSGYMLLGDPAARLPLAVSGARESAQRRSGSARPARARRPADITDRDSETQEPEHLLLEFLRTTDTRVANVDHRGEDRYVLRDPDRCGDYHGASIAWDEKYVDHLGRLDDLAAVGDKVPALADLLEAFLHNAGWRERILPRVQAARERGRRIVVTIRSVAHELFRLPWEMWRLDGQQPVCESPDIVLRYEAPAGDVSRADLRAPRRWHGGNRIGLVWSSKGGAVPVTGLLEVLRGLAPVAAFDVARDERAEAGLAEMKELLTSEPPVRILHILCHGQRLDTADPSKGYGLALHGSEMPVSPAELGLLLAEHGQRLRLVVLSACQSSNAGALGNDLDSVALRLHMAGIPAVIGARYPLTTRGDLEIARALYQSLTRDLGSLEQAFLAARVRARACADEHNALYPGAPSFDWAALQLYSYADLGTDVRPWQTTPYRGFESYRPEHAALFTGRDTERVRLRQRVDTLLREQRPRLLMVAGASGIGKSSLVQAGLVADLLDPGDVHALDPALTTGPAARYRWRHRYARPAPDWATGPVPRLFAAPPSDADDMAMRVLVIDQCEELFSDVADAGRRQEIVRELWRLSTEPDGRTLVVASIRIDHLPRFGDIELADGRPFDRVAALNEEHLFLVQQQPASQLTRLIDEPARSCGVRVPDGLRDRLIRDAQCEPGALPVLSYTLLQLWRQRILASHEGRTHWWLSSAAYRQMDGLRGVLEQNAEACVARFDGAEKAIQRRQLRRVLVQLMNPQDDRSQSTRKRARRLGLRPDDRSERGELEALAYDEVVAALTEAHILVQGDDDLHDEEQDNWLELAHESLVRHWRRLHGWYQEAVGWLAMRNELYDSARAWEEADDQGDTPASHLLQGARLARLSSAWDAGMRHVGAGDGRLIQRFMDASWASARRRRAERLALTRRARDGVRMGAVEQLHDDPLRRVAILREVEADDPATLPGWRAAALEELCCAPTIAVLEGHRGHVYMAEYSPDGRWLATGSADHTVRLWPTVGGSPRVLSGHRGSIMHLAFDRTGERLVTTSHDRTARLWHVADERAPLILSGHEGVVVSAAFSADGSQVVTACADGRARIFSVGDGSLQATFDERRVAGAGDETCWPSLVPTRWYADPLRHELLALWMIGEDMSDSRVAGHAVLGADFSPDGARVVTASAAGQVRVWHAREPTRAPTTSPCLAGDTALVSFAPAARRVVTVTRTGGIAVHDPLGQEKSYRFELGARVSACALSLDGGRMAVAVASGDVLLASLAELDEEAHRAADMARDGLSTLRAVSHESRHLRRLRGHSGAVLGLVFNRAGSSLATTSEDRTARVWQVNHPYAPADVLRGHAGSVTWAAFDQPGQHLATTSFDQGVRLWALGGALQPEGVTWPAPSHHPQLDEQHVQLAMDAGSFELTVSVSERPVPESAESAESAESIETVLRATANDAGGERLLAEWQHRGRLAALRCAGDGTRIYALTARDQLLSFPLSAPHTPIVLAASEADLTRGCFSDDGHLVASQRHSKVTGHASVCVRRVDGRDTPIVLTVTTTDEGTGRLLVSAETVDLTRYVMGTAYLRRLSWTLDGRRLRRLLWQVSESRSSVLEREQLLGEEPTIAQRNHRLHVEFARALRTDPPADDAAFEERLQAFRRQLRPPQEDQESF